MILFVVGKFVLLGVSYDGKGVNFVFFFVYVEWVELCVFDEQGNE